MKFGVNPLGMGLLGGIAGLSTGLEKYFEQERVLKNRLDAYKYRYDRMSDVAKQRQDFNGRMAALKLQAMQRNGIEYEPGPDGKIMMRQTHTVFDANGQPTTTKGPLMSLQDYSRQSSKAQPPKPQAAPNSYIETDPADGNTYKFTRKPDNTYSKSLFKPAGADKTVTPNALNSQVGAYMRMFDSAEDNPAKKNALLKSAGIDPTVTTDPKEQRTLFQKAAIAHVRDTAGQLGGGAGAGATQQDVQDQEHSSNNLDGLTKGQDGRWYTPQGAPVSFHNGAPFLHAIDAEGKPIPGKFKPYMPEQQAPGNAPQASAAPEAAPTGIPGILPTGNEDAFNQSVAGIGGEDNERPEEAYNPEDEEDQT